MLRFAEYGVIPSTLQIKYTLVYLRNRLLSVCVSDWAASCDLLYCGRQPV